MTATLMVRIVTMDTSSAILVTEKSVLSEGHAFTLAGRKVVNSVTDTPAVT